MNKILKFTISLLIIFLIQYISFIALKFLKINFPSPLLGIIILFFLLQFKIVKEDLIKDCCEFFLNNMILFFIPIFVGIICYTKIIYQNFLPIILVILITTFLTLVCTGLFFQIFLKYFRFLNIKKIKEGKEK